MCNIPRIIFECDADIGRKDRLWTGTNETLLIHSKTL
jgi:hypothetical protein